MKMFLSLLINQLKELTIISLNSDTDLVDGDGWKEFVCSFKQLKRFEFRFSFSFEGKLNIESKKVESFKSNYWLMDRKCFINITENSISTVPYFSPERIKYVDLNSPSISIWTNSPSQQILYENTKTIQFDIETLQNSQKEKHIYYENIENIDWNQISTKENPNEIISLIRTTFNLSKIIIFKGFPSNNSTIFMNYIQILPQLEEIHFNYTSKLFRKIRFLPQIRRLKISFDETDENSFFIKELDDFCRVFPNIEQIILLKRIENEFIFYLIERLNNLSSFGILCSLDDQILIDIEQTFISFTSIYSNNNQKKIIFLWIDNSQQHLIKQIKYQKRSKIKSKTKCILI